MGEEWLVRSIGLDGVDGAVQLGIRHDSCCHDFRPDALVEQM
jgi:hypothetical protein